MTNKTYDAMIKRNGKKKEANTEPVPPISKDAMVTRADPNKRPRKFSDYINRSGDSPLVALIASSLAKTGLVDKKDKVTQPYEAKVKKKKGGKVMFSRGGGVATQGTKFSRNG